MRKIIFVFLFIYSSLVFSSNNVLNLPEFPESHLIGQKIRCYDLPSEA